MSEGEEISAPTTEGPVESIEFELDTKWQELMRGAMEEGLDNYELFGHVEVSPMITEANKRTFEDLAPNERDWLKRELFRQLRFVGEDLEVVDTYTFTTPTGTSPEHGAEQARLQGEVQVRICQTPRIGEDMYLHELTRPDSSIEYIVAPHDFRL